VEVDIGFHVEPFKFNIDRVHVLFQSAGYYSRLRAIYLVAATAIIASYSLRWSLWKDFLISDSLLDHLEGIKYCFVLG